MTTLSPWPPAGDADPVGILLDCHEHIERSLSLLQALRRCLERDGPGATTVEAAQQLAAFFEHVDPLHHDDEELHVFGPLLRAQALEDTVRRGIATLRAEHALMRAQWPTMRSLLQRWGQAPGAGWSGVTDDEQGQVRRFLALYQGHIQLEERVVYPALTPSPVPVDEARAHCQTLRERHESQGFYRHAMP